MSYTQYQQNMTVRVCSPDDDLKAKVFQLRYKNKMTNAAIIMKVNKDELKVILDQELEDITIEEITDKLPSHEPRFVMINYVYKHDDGRVSNVSCFVYVSPQGSLPEDHILYAGSKANLVKETGLTKVFEIRSVEELTEEWLKGKLKVLH